MVLLTEQIIKGKTRLDKLEDVRNLNLWGQDLDDVSVLSKLYNVEVLSLSVNRLHTLRDFRHCTSLQELYLRKNDISDILEVQYLMGLKTLKVLWLCDNPCAEHPYYRQIIASMLAQLEKLDNLEITEQDREQALRNPEVLRYVNAPPEERAMSRLAAVSSSGVSGCNGVPPRSKPQAAPEDRANNVGIHKHKKNVLYAVMALVGELDEDDLIYVKREIEQLLGSMGR